MSTGKPKDNAFVEWIDEYGVDRLAKTLDVHPSTVVQWRTGRCDPRVNYMRRIKKLTRGKIGYDEMIDRFVLTTRIGSGALK